MNAKEELIKILYGEANAMCAELYRREVNSDKRDFIRLKIGYDKKEWDTFLKELDFDYPNKVGNQNLHGIVWLDDGSWIERKWHCIRLQCREWWEYTKMPEIPEILKFRI